MCHICVTLFQASGSEKEAGNVLSSVLHDENSQESFLATSQFNCAVASQLSNERDGDDCELNVSVATASSVSERDDFCLNENLADSRNLPPLDSTLSVSLLKQCINI